MDNLDVIVVGSGIAGMSAAVRALEGGARVALLERAPSQERGGNTRYTESYWRMRDADAVSDDFEERLIANSGGNPDPALVNEMAAPYTQWSGLARAAPFVDPELVSMLAAEAPRALAWLVELGARFEFLPNYFIAQSTTRMAPVGGGLALLEVLIERAESFGDQLLTCFQTTATGLSRTADRWQIDAHDHAHNPVVFHAPSVVLASGGFQGNPEMLAHYIGPQATYTRPVARGGQYNRGEGIRMALGAGAAPCGDFGSFHAQPVDPRSPEAEAVMLAYHLGILVNRNAERFTDEGVDMIDAVYEETTRQIMHQPGGLAYAIVDAQVDDVPNWQIAVRSRVAPVQADTLPELATQLGLPAAELVATVHAFNDACRDNDAAFDVMRKDGLTTTALKPAKSNWARALVKPPFRAWPVVATNCFTFGGVKVDRDARIINMDGSAIPGLYAAGEVVGLYYRIYTGSTSVMRGAVTGRQAGSHAARHASQSN